jgi:signal transduction histidine kinase
MPTEDATLIERIGAVLRRPGALLDVGLALGLSILVLAEASNQESRIVDGTLLFVTLPIAARRAWPIPVLLVCAFGILVTQGKATYVDVAALAIASFSVGEFVTDRRLSPISVLATAVVLALALAHTNGDPVLSLVLPFVILLPAWVVGDSVRAQRVADRERAEAAARDVRDREARMATAISDERRHIARELHDVVAHAMSVMLLQTGAARQVMRSTPDRAEEALLVAEATGRDAMGELRRLLGVLADDDDEAGIAPQPGLAQLPSLIERVREAGLAAELEIDGPARQIPSGVDVTAYRIVQEALTNALRYAHAPTQVHLVYEPSQLRLEVLDDGLTPTRIDSGNPGRGLVGMRERATLVGGRLEAGPRVGGGFAVRAWLPLAAPVG